MLTRCSENLSQHLSSHYWANCWMVLIQLQTVNNVSKSLDESFDLTMDIKNIQRLGHMARWVSLSPFDKGWQTGSPLVPYKLPRLLPHKGRVPGCSRDSPSWTQLLTREGEDREKTGAPFPGSDCPLLVCGWCKSPAQVCVTPVCTCLSCINGVQVLQMTKQGFCKEPSRKKKILKKKKKTSMRSLLWFQLFKIKRDDFKLSHSDIQISVRTASMILCVSGDLWGR